MDPQNKVKNLFEKRKIQNYLISVKKRKTRPPTLTIINLTYTFEMLSLFNILYFFQTKVF